MRRWPVAEHRTGRRPVAVAVAIHLLAQLGPAAGVALDQRTRSQEASRQQQAARSALRSRSGKADPAVPPLTPTQYLLISSPAESKIVYTQLSNFKSEAGVATALVDSGLSQPRGLALDHTHGYLYVADSGLRSIYRFHLIFQSTTDGTSTLTTDGVQLTIVTDRDVDWVTTDINGDVFFSDKTNRFVGHLTYATIEMLAKGEAEASSLVIVSHDQLLQESVDAVTSGLTMVSDNVPKEPTAPVAELLVAYSANGTPMAHSPSGISSDGVRVYWGNEVSGAKYGSAVRGETYPKAVPGPNNSDLTFQTVALAENVNTTYGLVKSSASVIFASDGGPNASSNRGGYVYGVADAPTPTGTPAVYALSSTLVSPRGLCWDGDQTVYVADEGANMVYSMPVGRLADGVPLGVAVGTEGPFGLALLSVDDAFYSGGAAGRCRAAAGFGALAVALAAALAVPA
mmetsp:Transcript_55422/g.144128  ORF Transcript_55422/g.144128 Transcript_55422/m.144128 type:complete len:457 (+) Transcript_55422:41-1411(+)